MSLFAKVWSFKSWIIILSLALCLSGLKVLSFLTNKSHRNPHLTMTTSLDSAPPLPTFAGFNHCGLLVSDVEKSLRFYCDILGFENESHLRPSTLDYPGAFLKVGNRQQIHLMQLLPVNPDLDESTVASSIYGGKDRHFAVNVENFDLLVARLQYFQIPFTLSSSGRKALFCRDRDGNALEFVQPSP